MKNKSAFLFLPMMALTAGAGSAAILLSENFESLALGPYTSPTETPSGTGSDWTATAPAGWTRDQGATPVGNPVEFYGWTFHNLSSWVATEGDQLRSAWTGGSGTVMVADPDAYDDGTNIDTGLYNVFITTPTISLAGTTGAFLNIAFDSSFRSEATQIAMLQVSTNGGPYTTLLTYDGNVLPDGDLFNDPISISIPNPGTGDVQYRMSLTNGSNDWWWAIDNVVVSDVVPEPSAAMLMLLPVAALGCRRRRIA